MNKLFLPFIFFLSLHSLAQQKTQEKYTRRLSVSQWVNEMVNCKDSAYKLEHAEIFYDPMNFPEDHLYNFYSPNRDSLDKILGIKPLIIKSQIKINDCRFIKGLRLYFYNIEFQNKLKIIGCEFFSYYFINCKFYKVFKVSGNEFNYFGDCSFSGPFYFNGNTDQLSFFNCKFNLINRDVSKGFENLLLWISSRSSTNFNLTISGCLFDSVYSNTVHKNNKNSIIDISGAFERVYLDGLNFENSIVEMSNCTVREVLIVKDCKFELPLELSNFNFPPLGTNFPFSTIQGNKICLPWQSQNANYFAQGDSQLMDQWNYNELIGTYKKLHNMYKLRGDDESANACFVEMKDIQTRRQNFLFRKNPSLKLWFDWQLNRFLKFFCSYGTDPAKSLIFSIWVILVFAGFYLFTYSDWDKINLNFLILKSDKLLTYFRSTQKLEDFYSEENKGDFNTFENFKKKIFESKSEIPFFMNWFLKPLYHLALVNHVVMKWLYRRMEILSGRWIDLTQSKKIYVGTIVAFSVIFYLSYILFIRCLNSIFLSINTFSTLGFGNIPVKGISRYVAILEGFFGWFLLTIFSVSLISQILG